MKTEFQSFCDTAMRIAPAAARNFFDLKDLATPSQSEPQLVEPGRATRAATFLDFFFDITKRGYHPSSGHAKELSASSALLRQKKSPMSAPRRHGLRTHWTDRPVGTDRSEISQALLRPNAGNPADLGYLLMQRSLSAILTSGTTARPSRHTSLELLVPQVLFPARL